MSNPGKVLSACLLVGAALLTHSAVAVEQPIKKTMDGRCIAPDHPEYWKTKVYVAKPTMEACIESGGRPA